MYTVSQRQIAPVCALVLLLALLPAVGASSAPAAPGDEQWANGFGPPGEGNGLSASPFALLVDEHGDLHAAGYFTQAGGTSVNRVARWDGTGWHRVGYMSSPPPLSLALDGAGTLYVAGAFSSPPGYIARWTGSEWVELSGGLNDQVHALAVDQQDSLYAGGYFTKAGLLDASRIARWNGTSWSPLGSGMGGANPSVEALAVDPVTGHLYAGGHFETAGGVGATNIAHWDGSDWSALDSGVNGWVMALVFDAHGNLYAGGDFTEAGGVMARHIARWDGSGWTALGSGLSGQVSSGDYPVNALAFDSARGILYAGGNFTEAGERSADRIAAWDGVDWAPLGSGIGGSHPAVRSLALDGLGNLWVGGSFETAGEKPSANIARWDVLFRRVYLPLIMR